MTDKLARGAPLTGIFSQLGSPVVLETLGAVGFDFAVIDCQHGVTDPFGASLGDQIRSCSGSGVAPVVRTVSNDRGQILRALDLGAEAVLVPQISTADQARAAVDAAHYAPRGTRSCCPGIRGTGYGTRPWGPYYATAAADTLVLLLIEDGEGVRNIDEIAAVDGVGGLFFGPFDLAVAMGYDPRGDEVREQRALVYTAAARNGLVVGDFPWDVESACEMAAAGAQLLAIGIDLTLFGDGAQALMADARARIPGYRK